MKRPTLTDTMRPFCRTIYPAVSVMIAVALLWCGGALAHAAEPGSKDAPPPIILRYLGMQQAHPGEPFVLKARLRDGISHAPLAGHWVRFHIGSEDIPARTDGNGLAVVATFPSQLPPDDVTVAYVGPQLDAATALLSADDGKPGVAGLSVTQLITAPSLTPAVLTATLAPGQTISESKAALLPGDPQPADLVLSLDGNEGMSGFLAGAKGVAEDTVEALTTDGLDVRFAVISHRDYPAAYQSFGYETAGGPVEYSPADDYAYHLEQALSVTKTEVLAAINAIVAGSTPGDPPANYSRVLYESVAELLSDPNPVEGVLGYRPGAVKIVALFGNNLPHDNDLNEDIPDAVGVNSTGGDPGRDGVMQETSNPANIGVGNDDLDWQTVLDQMQGLGASLLATQYTPFDQGRWQHWAQRTGGELTLDYDALQTAIRNRVLSGGQAGVVTLLASAGYGSWVSVEPAQYVSVTLPANLPFQVEITPPAGTPPGSHHFTINLVVDDVVVASQSVTITVAGAPDLQLTKTSNAGERISAGGQIVYTLHYTNVGNVPATGVLVTETVPAFTTFSAGASSPHWVCEQNGAAGAQCIHAIDTLATGATGQIAFAVTVNHPLSPDATAITNTASIGDDQGSGADVTPTDNSSGVAVLVSHPPEAVDDSFDVDEDSVNALFDVLANDFDIDLDALTLVGATAPAHGVAVVQANKVVYTPTANYHGSDGFAYVISDGVLTVTANVAITVRSVNDPPAAMDDSFIVQEGSSANALAVLGNDQDIDGDTLTVTAVGTPEHGTTSLVGGIVRYTPAPDFAGADIFTYTISDGEDQDSATVAMEVTPRPGSSFSLSLISLRTGDNSDGVITVGQLATVTIAFTNTGQVALTNAPLALTFDPSRVTPIAAQPAPSQTNTGQLTWQNLISGGSLAPGQHIHVQVVLRGQASTHGSPGQAMTIQSAASGVTDAFGRILTQKVGEDSLRITRPGMTLTSEVVGTGSQAAPVGSLITFTVRLQNTGDTVITHAPLNEHFPDAVLGFVRASVVGFSLSNDGATGRVQWNDLTDQVGDIGLGQQVEVLITYRLLTPAPTFSRQTTIVGARDQFGDSLPSVTAATTIARIALQLHIVATPPAGGQLAPGAEVSYEIQLTNSGGVTLTQLSVDGLLTGDGLLTPLVLQGATTDGICLVTNVQEPSTGRRIYSVAQLAPGVSCSIIIQARMAQSPQQGGMTFSVSVQAAQMGQPVVAHSSHTAGSLTPGVESFTAITGAMGIRLEWVTRSETGLTGFQVWRGANTDRSQAVRVTDAPIPAKGAAGSSYSYSEMPPLFDTTYFYWLEVISDQGSVDEGPLGVSLPALGRTWLPLIQRAGP
jgi:uncharacterized repeat protein (TIGR01451 family)